MENTKTGTICDMIDGITSGKFDIDLTGKRVAIIGGGAVGIDVAEYFAPRGAKCTIVEMMPEVGRDLDPVSKNAAKQLFADHDVEVCTGTKLMEVRPDNFLIEKDGEQRELAYDYGFVCLGMRAHAPLIAELEQKFPRSETEIYNIGDSARARRIIDGVREGHDILEVLKNRGFLAE